jgi:hypothetical protein
MRRLMILAIGLIIILLSMLSLFLVVSQEGFSVTFQLDLQVTSSSPLWNPGEHEFSAEGTGYVNSIIDREFNVSGTGTVEYAITGGNGYPPGPFSASINFAGEAQNHRLNGPFTLNGEYMGTTVEESTTQGYTRTESVNNLLGSGNMSIPWDPASHHGPLPDLFEIRSERAIVDFSSVGGDGKSFTIRVTGSTTITPGWSDLPVPEVTTLGILAFTGILVVAIRKDGQAE